ALSGAGAMLSPIGTTVPFPALAGSSVSGPALPLAVPRRRLADLVSPGESGQFIRPGASTIYREQGQRLIAIKFGVRGRDLAGTVAECREKVEPLIQSPYRTEWSGEFQEMEEAEVRMARWFGLSLVLILVLLFIAFGSVLDALVVMANVLAVSIGGIWALKLCDLNLNISAAVGFISILGVAVMNGLIMVSSFNRLRAQGVELQEAIKIGVEHRV